MDGEFPRRPQASNGSRTTKFRQMPASPLPSASQAVSGGAMHYDKDEYVTERKQKVHSASGDYKEKETHKHKEIDAVGVVYTDKTRQSGPDNVTDKKNRPDADDSMGCMWLVWVILIFIIILIVILAALWMLKPDCVTRECDTDDSGCEVDLCKAALYAFIITFFLVLIGCCLCWCCKR